MFTKLLDFFKDPRIAIPSATAVGVTLVGGGAWFATRNWMIAIAIALALALIVLIVILLRTLRTAERQETLSGGLEGPVSPPTNGSGAANGAAGAGIRSIFIQALNEIKRSRLGPEGIHSLPWWVTLGATGSGKTELIRNAGLDIPAEFAHSLRSGPTSGVHFILSNQAVVMDTAGQIVDSGEDTPEDWQTLLLLLKKHRPSSPLEGIVISLSAASLATEDPSQTTELARSIRRRLNEVSDRLEFDIPIYVVVTQLDQIRGFPELISAMPAERMREVFGWTNDRRDVADVAETATASLARIVSQLDEVLPELLLREPDPIRRRDLFGFPQELQALNLRIVDFLKDAFAPSVYQEVPFLRGVYFTSAARGGSSVSSRAARLGHAWSANMPQSAMPAGGIFSTGLFREVIVGDQDLSVETAGVGRRTRNVVIGLTAAFSLSCLALATVAFVGNFTLIRDLEAKTKRLVDAPSSLDAGDALRTSILAARDPEAVLGVPFMARTRERAWSRATDTFNWAIEREHIRPAKKRLSGVVRQADHNAFEALAVLAMDVSWLARRTEVDPAYRPKLMQYTPFGAREGSRDAQILSEAYDAYVRWAPEAELRRQIKDERNLVLESATSLLDLRRLEEWSERQSASQPPVQYAQFGLQDPNPAQPTSVMGAYTRQGWEGLVRDLVKAVEESGGTQDDNIRRFRSGYVTRFDRLWRDFLMAVPATAKPNTNVLESPHLKLFDRLVSEVGTDLPRDGRRPAWMDVALQIRDDKAPAPATEAAEGAAPPPLPPWLRYREALDQVSIDATSAVGQTGDRPLQLALKMGDASAFSNALGLLDELIPRRGETLETRKIRSVLSMPIFDAARFMLSSAVPELNSRWYDMIYKPYEVDGQDPISLYNPSGGALARFMAEELDPFFDRDAPKQVLGDLKLPVSAAFLRWLDHAQSLQQALYPGAGSALEVPVRLDGIPSQVISNPGTFVTRRDLRMDCANSVQTFEYREGVGSESLVWRPDCQQVTLRIWVRPPGEPSRELLPRKEWSGPLALPQFLREGKRVSDDQFQWNLDYGGTVVRISYRLRSGTTLLGLEHKSPPRGIGSENDAGQL